MTFSSIVGGGIMGTSSHIASILAKLWNDEALSNDEPSTVTVCELGAVPIWLDRCTYVWLIKSGN